MSQSDQKTANGKSVARSNGTAALPAVAARSRTPETKSNRAADWDELFLHASPAQRSEMLALAQKQGLLYAHQIPAITNGKKPAPLQEDQGRLNLLSNLQNHPPESWTSVAPEAIKPFDDALDCWQRHAVARAMSTTDICLIAGLPGTGKSRVLAEIITQAASRGLRVLFLAPHSPAIDVVLDQVAGRDAVYAVRCVEPGEKLETLTPTIRDLTQGERARRLREAATSATRAQEQAEACCQRRRDEQTVWPELRQLAEKLDDFQRRLGEAQQREEILAAEVDREAAQAQSANAAQTTSAFTSLVGEACAKHQAALEGIENSLEATEAAGTSQKQALDDLVATRNRLLSLAQAKQQGRWWSLAWWRATFAGNIAARIEELTTKIQAATALVEATAQQVESWQEQQTAAIESHQHFLQRTGAEELSRRRAELQTQIQDLEKQKNFLDTRWRALNDSLSPAELRPAMPSAAAVDEANCHWQAQRKADEELREFSKHWNGYLQDSADSLTARLPALANVVAGTYAAIAADRHFGPSSGLVFDLVIFEEAHQLGEADFFRLARRGRRWTLVGEPGWDCGPASRPARSPSSFFHRLWLQFHCDPGKLNYAWAAEGERLCCKLRPLPTEQRQRLESERLADFPDIELRILSLPHAPPTLAEVVFPASLTLGQAKQFIFQELQELAVSTTAQGGVLAEEPERWTFHLHAGETQTLEVALGAGLREVLAAVEPTGNGVRSWRTARLEFDKQASWDRGRVERWLHDHLKLRDLGRTMLLEVPHRMRPELALLLSDMLYGGHRAFMERTALSPAIQSTNGAGCPMIFFPVPAIRQRDKNGAAPGPKSSRVPREGAGLEIELGAGRATERVPADLRGLVPGRGLVNCSEAQALVRTLEGMVAEPSRLAAICQPHPPGIAVATLFPAQADLIRRLVERSQRIQHSGVPVTVGLAADFCQREFPVVVLSLTRSSARAVPFAEQAAHFVHALTRARSQIILFGDPGTLTRRSQWQGRLDHLDEAAARQEEVLIKDLVRYLQGNGRHAWAFHLSEGHP